jgi:hypothetical protein
VEITYKFARKIQQQKVQKVIKKEGEEKEKVLQICKKKEQRIGKR